MAKVKPNYWLEKRSIENLVASEQKGEVLAGKVVPLYQGALRNINAEINRIYQSYADKTGLSVDELAIIIKGDDKARFYQSIKNNLLKLGIDINAVYDKGYLARLTRLDALKAQVYWELMAIAPQFRDTAGRTYAEIVQTTYQKTGNDIYEAQGLQPSFATLDTTLVNKILGERWAGGNYSTRVWGNTNKLALELPQLLGEALISGTRYQKTVNDLRNTFNFAKAVVAKGMVKGEYEARRLVLTETAYFNQQAELQSYKDLGVRQYEFSAILDKKTSSICKAHNNKRYYVDEAVTGENYPPLHPHCRSTTYVILDSDEPAKVYGTPNPPEMQVKTLPPEPPVTITTDTGKKVAIPQPPILQQPNINRASAIVSETLEKQALRYDKVEDFIKAQGTPLYHGTNRNFTSFDIDRAFTSRNAQIGAGKAIYLTKDKGVAMQYANANSNASFDTVVIEQVEKYNKQAGELLRALHTKGFAEGFTEFRTKYPNGIQDLQKQKIDVNDISDIVGYIRGAKIDAPTNGASDMQNFFATGTSSKLPEYITQIAKRIGITDIPTNARVLEVYIDKTAKIKKYGYIDDIQNTVEKAKKGGYDGMQFTSAYTVDNVPEIAIFNATKVKTKDELIEIYNNAHSNVKTEENLKVYQFTDNYKKLTGNSIELTDYEKRVIDKHFIKIADTPQKMVSRTGTRRAQFDGSNNTIEFSKYGVEQAKDIQKQVLLHEFGHAIDKNANPKTMTRWVNVGGQSKEVEKPIPYSDSRKLFDTQEIAVIVKSRMPLDKWGLKVENDTSFLRYGEVRKENGALTYLKMGYIKYAKNRKEVFAEAYSLYRTQYDAYKDRLPKLFAFFDEITV